ncbi:MAG: elongation factor G [Deltaproteobacteria bacterium]|nr:elongation factor G [Deltaproteobacteria bacterium]
MQQDQIENTRNFAIIGHSGDGKTSLGDALLHRAGAIQELGKVDENTSVLNYLPEERDGHTASISSHIFGFDWNEGHITLVDTPGDPNYQGDGLVALQAVDGALLVVSASDGVKAGTEKMLIAADEQGIAAIAFINGLDRPLSDFASALESMKALDRGPIAIAMPMGSGDTLNGVIDLLHMKAITSKGEGPIPDELREEADRQREALVEAVAETNDELLEKYLEEGSLEEDEVLHGLAAAARAKTIIPVLCGSAETEVGIDLVLRDLVDLLPSPVERGEWEGSSIAGEEPQVVKPDVGAPFSAVVFKTVLDRYAGTLSVLRIVSGTLSHDDHILNATNGDRHRVSKLYRLQGEKHVDATEAGPGDVVGVPKLKDARTGHVLTAEKGGIRLKAPHLPEGVISYAIASGANKDEEKVFSALAKLVEEDPSLHLGREESTGEFLLTGMGELHIRTTVNKLKRVFSVDVNLKTPKVPYRETITTIAEHVEGKLKKQTGGAGMYGVCFIDVEPLERGAGFEFENKVVGGAIPRGLIPAVEKGAVEACRKGPLAGYPVVDIKVRCVDGKYHSVDSNEMAFHLAGSFALKSAVEKAKPVLLEPYMTAEISVPDECVGDVLGDLSSRRGQVQTTEAMAHGSRITAKVPMAEMLDYASTLTSVTGGKGEFHLTFSHYSQVPAKIGEKIVEGAKAAEAKS